MNQDSRHVLDPFDAWVERMIIKYGEPGFCDPAVEGDKPQPALQAAAAFKPGDRVKTKCKVSFRGKRLHVYHELPVGSEIQVAEPPFSALKFSQYLWFEDPRAWGGIAAVLRDKVEATNVASVVTRVCHCSTVVLFAEGCQCGGA